MKVFHPLSRNKVNVEQLLMVKLMVFADVPDVLPGSDHVNVSKLL